MKKRLAACALAVVPLALAAAPAQADTPGCVTRAEYRKVSKGNSLAKAHRVFDTRGRQVFHMTGYQSREYKTCVNRQWGFVMVDYERRGGTWKVTSKSAYWG